MKNLSDFLKKFRVLVKDDSELKKIISESFKSAAGIATETESFEFKNGIISLKSEKFSPSQKNAVFLRKKEILLEIEKRSGKNFKDIRF